MGTHNHRMLCMNRRCELFNAYFKHHKKHTGSWSLSPQKNVSAKYPSAQRPCAFHCAGGKKWRSTTVAAYVSLISAHIINPIHKPPTLAIAERSRCARPCAHGYNVIRAASCAHAPRKGDEEKRCLEGAPRTQARTKENNKFKGLSPYAGNSIEKCQRHTVKCKHATYIYECVYIYIHAVAT